MRIETLIEDEIKPIFLKYAALQYGDKVARELLDTIPDCNYAKAIAQAATDKAVRLMADLLKNYGITLTSEGILVPYADEWDYLYNTPRRILLRGNDEGEAAKEMWQSFKRLKQSYVGEILKRKIRHEEG